jgi:predicted CopG family antitoxin
MAMIQISDELYAALQKRAREDERSPSAVARLLLRKVLEDTDISKLRKAPPPVFIPPGARGD